MVDSYLNNHPVPRLPCEIELKLKRSYRYLRRQALLNYEIKRNLFNRADARDTPHEIINKKTHFTGQASPVGMPVALARSPPDRSHSGRELRPTFRPFCSLTFIFSPCETATSLLLLCRVSRGKLLS